MIPPTLGLLIGEKLGVAVDSRFYWIFIREEIKLITNHYLTPV
jgi:hypothetical protein